MNDGPALATTAATAGPYLAAKLRALEGQLRTVVPRVLASSADAAAVHDLRVALRRTRTVLEIGRGVLGRFQTGEVRRALRDVQQATSVLRDEEVLRETVTSLGVHRPDVQAWLASRTTRERRLRAGIARLVRAGELDRGLELLHALLAFRVDPANDRRIHKVARRSVDRARREVERRRGARPDDVEGLHDLRIAYKRLRYTADTFAAAMPGDLAGVAQSAARFQGRLGDLHDVDVAIACVRRARALSDDGRTDLLAALDRLRAERAASYAKELGVAFVPALSQAVGTDSLRKISTR
jgi:CHAD domain-containing protein